MRKFKMDQTELNKIITTEVSKSPNNLQAAFLAVAEKTGYSKGTIVRKWYGLTNKINNKVYHYPALRDNCGVVFTVVGNKKTFINGKVASTSEGVSSVGIWGKVKQFFSRK